MRSSAIHAAQLCATRASTHTIFTLSALTSLTEVSSREAVSLRKTTSEATQVHTCRRTQCQPHPQNTCISPKPVLPC